MANRAPVTESRERPITPIADNRRARHEYAIEETLEVGVVLAGTEVKSLRAGKVQLVDGFARLTKGELWLENVHISHYKEGNQFNQPEKRSRKLLAHSKEIAKLEVKLHDQGATLIPLKMYFKGNKAKVLLGLGHGRKSYDKREAIKERDAKRDLRRED
jgi:SsrA-binding protein